VVVQGVGWGTKRALAKKKKIISTENKKAMLHKLKKTSGRKYKAQAFNNDQVRTYK